MYTNGRKLDEQLNESTCSDTIGVQRTHTCTVVGIELELGTADVGFATGVAVMHLTLCKKLIAQLSPVVGNAAAALTAQQNSSRSDTESEGRYIFFIFF